MALIVPNATDTTGGNRYAALDQAEPDSLDVEILSNIGRTGVVTGCTVTSNSSSTNVNVANGVISLNGVAYTVNASPTYALPSAPADSRFDLIVARVTNGVASLATVSGTSSATNPTFPRSRSVLTGGYSPSIHVDLNTDVVLAAIYRTGASTVTNARIADKRALVSSSIALQGTAAPTSATGYGKGNLYFKNNVTDLPADPTSGVYVKLASGEWIELAKNIGLHLPVGAMVEWPTNAAVPTGFLEALGQALSTDVYPTLFGVYGYQHGGSGSTFNLPDYRDVFKRGTSNGALTGTSVSGGADTTTLTEANLAPHTHSNNHTHTFVHSHNTNQYGHSHASWMRGLNRYNVSGLYEQAGGPLPGMNVMQAYDRPTSTDYHTHYTTSQDTSTTSQASTPTGSVGSGTPISRIPASKHVRNIIRVA